MDEILEVLDELRVDVIEDVTVLIAVDDRVVERVEVMVDTTEVEIVVVKELVAEDDWVELCEEVAVVERVVTSQSVK